MLHESLVDLVVVAILSFSAGIVCGGSLARIVRH